MKLSEIQGNLRAILSEIDILAAVDGDVVFVDNGLENSAIETSLQNIGVAIIVMDPQATVIDDAGRGCVRLAYSTTVWARTNPKVTVNDESAISKWSPLVLEEKILSAVLTWSKTRDDYGFVIPPGLEPETDWADVGNHSRLIRFATHINFK